MCHKGLCIGSTCLKRQNGGLHLQKVATVKELSDEFDDLWKAQPISRYEPNIHAQWQYGDVVPYVSPRFENLKTFTVHKKVKVSVPEPFLRVF
jgi:hypothetical protein